MELKECVSYPLFCNKSYPPKNSGLQEQLALLVFMCRHTVLCRCNSVNIMTQLNRTVGCSWAPCVESVKDTACASITHIGQLVLPAGPLAPHSVLHTSAAASAKSLQSCPTLCDPIDSSPPGSPVPGILQQEHWSGLPFPSPMHESEKWKWSHSFVSNS